MKRGPIIHGVLLLAALVFAYQTWTREEKIEPKTGKIKVWRLPEGSITSVVYDSKLKTVRMEKRTGGNEAYWWGTETKNTTKKVKRPDLPPGPDGKEQTVDEVSTTVREFAVGKKGEEIIGHLTQLNALRELGNLPDEKLQEYGLDDSSSNLTVTYEGGSKNLIIGSKVFSGSDRFVRDADTGKAYAVAGVVVAALLDGQGGLQLRDYHRFDDEDLGRVAIRAGQETRELVRLVVESDEHKGVKGRKTWADARTPDKPDVTMANFLTRVKGLNALSYEPELTTEKLKLLVRVEYKSEKGADMGWLELYEKTVEAAPAPDIDPKRLPAPVPGEAADQAGATPDGSETPAADQDAGAATDEAAPDGAADAAAAGEEADPAETTAYYMRTELTRTLALVSKGGAVRLAEDINQIFGSK